MEGEKWVLLWVAASVQGARRRNWLIVVWVWLGPPLVDFEKEWAGVEGKRGEFGESYCPMVCGRKGEA